MIPANQIPQNEVTQPADAALPPAAQQDPNTPSLCLMIDNYDSFTFNLYQYLCELGAEMMVKRNDEVTMDEVEELYTSRRLRSIVISPGPGHPRTDSGICRSIITWAAGKVPVLGVCMGLECIVDVLGGEIAYAGEILHGKTSLVTHDGRGCFADIPQLIPSTRYHSLAARLKTLPEALVVTATTQESGVIMGVRHKEYTIEAVQYHPESVMSEGGRELLKNFLRLEGGKWGGKNEWCGVVPHDAPNGTHPVAPAPAKSALPTILDRIHEQRIADIEASSALPSSTPAILTTALRLHAAPPITPLLARISQTLPAHPAVMAEIKRASPSKGDISIRTSAPEQALKYALAGASVISVLTEPKWFKGALSDLLSVRMALDALPNRPALLRKDFIISTYQIDEARLHGADTVLLIVAMLSTAQLQLLYAYSVSLGMEPLVEVNNADELSTALDLGAKVIGVNNRNLHDFNVDMGTTSRLADVLRARGREDVVLCALSGITGRADVERYVEQGVKAVLVGESLMRAEDPKAFMHEMLGLSSASSTREQQRPLVKICGVQRFEDAKVAVEAGADFIGLIFARSKRQIALPVARQIASFLATRRANAAATSETLDDLLATATSAADPLAPVPWFTTHARALATRTKPLLVGVFQNQPLAFIQSCISAVPLDAVQLHGDEPVEWARQLSVPVIKAFRVSPDSGEIQGSASVDRAGCNHLVLLDAAGKSGGAGGGEGISFDWSVATSIVDRGETGTHGASRLPIILAGGLHPGNVAEAVRAVRPWCVDVSSGVESADGGAKDAGKVEEFIRNAKGA
ncbi:anthranilate synthase / indole-3-glycerol phosphate synthase [Naganishia albida]|nr:anthranilate synthase / indole-3-glycerol phosphate synthase [Naganishia albida]